MIFPSETDISEPKKFEGEFDFNSLHRFILPFSKTKTQNQNNQKENQKENRNQKEQQQSSQHDGFELGAFKLSEKNGKQICGLESGHLCVVLFAKDFTEIIELQNSLIELRRKFGNKFKFSWAIESEQTNFHSYFLENGNAENFGRLLIFNEKKHAWNNDFTLNVEKLGIFLEKVTLGDVRFTRRSESSAIQSVLQLLK